MVNVLNTLTTSTTPVCLITGVSKAPVPPNPAMISSVAGTVYPSPGSSTATSVIEPATIVTVPATAGVALAPTGLLNCRIGGFTEL